MLDTIDHDAPVLPTLGHFLDFINTSSNQVEIFDFSVGDEDYLSADTNSNFFENIIIPPVSSFLLDHF